MMPIVSSPAETCPPKNALDYPRTLNSLNTPGSPPVEPKAVSDHHSDSFRQPQLTVSLQAFSMFLINAIEKIASERETKKTPNSALRNACEEALQLLKQQPNGCPKLVSDDRPSAHLPPLRSHDCMLLADERLLRPFQLACSLKSPKIVITAVDSLQKLIAYGHVPNSAVGSNGRVRIIEQIVTTICSCFQGVHTDDGVQLQVLKALLTVITSSVVEIHEADVLLAIRTCYNIFMATKSPINQATARATLTQIISIIFQRMEQTAQDANIALSSSDVEPKIEEANETVDAPNPVDDQDLVPECPASKSGSDPDISSNCDSESDVSRSDGMCADSIVRSILDEIIQSPITVDHEKESHPSSIQTSADQSSGTPEEEARPIDVNGIPNGPINSQDAKDGSPEAVTMAHVTQKDAFLVFRSLCRLATKEFGGSRSPDTKSNAVRSKTLSLQLLSSIFQQPGPLFLSSEIFITAIKQYLCVALIRNGISPVGEVCELSVNIFLALLTYFKPQLKRQIEVFLKDVFLEILESPKSTFEHKWVIMEALRRICADAQCVVDIYLNYDCDMNMANIFERLTTSLAKIAQGRYSMEHGTSIIQRQALRTSGIECLVLILRCMIDWSHELYVTPEPQSFLGSQPSVATAEPVDGGLSANPTVPKAVDDPGDFESRKAQKEILENGIDLFNKGKAIQGLRLLQESGLVGNSVEAVAEILQTEERLCKSRIGDFLGENDPYSLRVMYAYVDRFDFSGKEFVSSMREFLAGFRLPGEAQKIDRLMEKFAARYCACNPSNELFTSADTAYVLAFSIIMLTTDLHSHQIKPHHRMTKESYIRMNRGINESQDLPEAYLAQIYDQIANCEIRLRSDDAMSRLTGSKSSTTDLGTRPLRTVNGSSVPISDELLGAMESTSSDFTSATHGEHVRPMFKITWTPFLAAFSVGLQDCDALDVAHLCLEGIRYAIRIACIFHLEMERDAYVQALARFTLLLTSVGHSTGSGFGGPPSGAAGNHPVSRRPKSENFPTPYSGAFASGGVMGSNGSITPAMSTPETMKQKNVDTIRTLITVAQTDGNYLGHAWLDILRCISQLESAHLITPTGGQTNGSLGNAGLLNRAASFASPHGSTNGSVRRAPGPSAASSTLSISSASGSSSTEPVAPGSLAAASVDPKKAAILHEVMGETGSHSVVVAVDKIFTGSVRLNGDAIEDFVKALCQVSREELMLPQPRTFSLQKVVEISYYNLGRVRLQWSRVWEHIGGHFTAAGQSANEDVAEFVLDSLRQLSVKLIEKGELPNFHFQKEFLRPFVSILDNGQNLTRKIQDMVVRCTSQLVHSQHMNIRSGWANIFAVFHRVASSSDEAIVNMAFETCNFTVCDVLINHLHVILGSFQPLVKLLADFACNLHFPDTAMESIRLIRICAQIVSERCAAFTALQSLDSAALPTLASVVAGGMESPKSRPVGDSRSSGHLSPYVGRSPTSPCDDDQVWLKGWMPVLCELFRVINSCKLDVRTRGLTIFFDILKTYGDQFKSLWWRETFSIIFRVFQHFRSPSSGEHFALSPPVSPGLSSMEQTEWMNTTCNHTLFSIVDVFTQFYDVLSGILLDDVYGQLRWCCLQEHEQLARSGTSCLETLVLSTGNRFTYEIWERTVQLIVGLFEASVPHQLLSWRPDSVSSATGLDSPYQSKPSSPGVPRYLAQARLFADLLIKCVVQYELIQAVDHILFYSSHSRNEDAHYLAEARELAILSYPAYSAAVAASSAGNILRETTRTTSSTSVSSDQQWIPDEIMDADEATGGIPTLCWLGCSGSRMMLGPKPLPLDPRGMYSSLSPRQRLTLARCLLESHTFAKAFNSNDEQRSVLFEAGFKVKAKPNLLKQETHSLLCSLRILFRLAEEKTDVQEETEELLDRVILDALSYYNGLLIDGHRQAWDPCLILIVTHLTRLSPATRFHRHAMRLYAGICDLVSMAGGVSPEVASLMRLFLLRCGAFFLPPLHKSDIA